MDRPTEVGRGTPTQSLTLTRRACAYACHQVAGCVLWYGSTRSPPRSLDHYKLADASGLPVMLGMCIFIVTAHCEIISIEQSLSRRLVRLRLPHSHRSRLVSPRDTNPSTTH